MIRIKIKTRWDEVLEKGAGWTRANYKEHFETIDVDIPELEKSLRSRDIPTPYPTVPKNIKFISKEVVSVVVV